MRIIALMLLLAGLAGCADPMTDGLPGDGGADPGHGFAPQQGSGQDVQGPLQLVVELRDCDAGYCLYATATNHGPRSYWVSNLCVPPHSEHMERDGQDVYPREPRAYCAAFGVREWTAGEAIAFNYTWDGKLWKDGGGGGEDSGRVPAEPGAYQWTLKFHAYDDEDGSAAVILSVTHTVVIGAT